MHPKLDRVPAAIFSHLTAVAGCSIRSNVMADVNQADDRKFLTAGFQEAQYARRHVLRKDKVDLNIFADVRKKKHH